jgi:hypothetical protein
VRETDCPEERGQTSVREENEKNDTDRIRRELEAYSVRGAKISLNGVPFEPRTIASLVAESGCYMRDYQFSRDGKLEALDFRPVRNR